MKGTLFYSYLKTMAGIPGIPGAREGKKIETLEWVLWYFFNVYPQMHFGLASGCMFGSQINTVQMKKWVVSEVYLFPTTLVINRC